MSSIDHPFDGAGRLSEDGRTAFATIHYDKQVQDLDATALDGLNAATAPLERADIEVAMSGEVVDEAAVGGFPIGELIGLAVAVLLLIAVLRNTSLTLRATASSVSSCRIRCRAAACSSCWPVVAPSASPRSIWSCLSPAVDRRLRDREGHRELLDLRTGTRQLDHLAANLRAVMTWHLGSPPCRSIPEPRPHFSRVRSRCPEKQGELH